MLSVLLTILPVFLILGAGYLAGRVRYVQDNVSDALNNYALKIGVPVLLFMAMVRLDFAKAFHLNMLISFYAGAFTCFAIAIWLSRLVWKRRPGESVSVGFSAVFSNTLLMGYPISLLAFGEVILAPVFGIIALHASLLYAVGMTTMEFVRRDGRGAMATLKNAFRAIMGNSLMIGILLGLLVNVSGIELFEPLEQALDMIRASAIPVSLVGIGIALNRYSISSDFAETLMVCGLALFVHPAVTLLLAHYTFGLDILFVQAAVTLAAMPSGMNIYIFATLYDRAVNLSASVLIIGNILAIFTVPAWLVLLKGLG